MASQGVDGLIIPLGGDMKWLIGDETSPSERLTALVIKSDETVLVTPSLEYRGLNKMPNVFSIRCWDDGDSPIDLIHELLYGASRISFGEQMWARNVFKLQDAFKGKGVIWQDATAIISPIRRRKEPAEIAALAEVAACVDRVIADLQAGKVLFRGRTERQVADDVDRLMKSYGHEKVDFVMVAFGPNVDHPHHEPDNTIIGGGGILQFDIGGSKNGYFSDTTRCLHIGKPSAEISEAYDLLFKAHAAAVATVKPDVPANQIDRVARDIIEQYFPGKFIHRTGHGIGLEIHEHPFIVKDNYDPLESGNVFSIEPGIYNDRKWGMRLEDIVVVTDNGAQLLNHTCRDLVAI